MKNKALISILALLPLICMAQGSESSGDSKPEEVVITGQRVQFEMREAMWAAEARAYAVFNQFNDEKRFNISCSKSQPTGTRFITQSCQPEFEIRATRAHAQDYLQSMRGFNEGTDGNVAPTAAPMEVEISRQQEDYKRKFRQIAEQHPEFLKAIEEFSKAKANYEGVAGSADAKK